MRHYEIVFLVHPDQSDQTQSVLNKFSSIVTESGGSVQRSENIGNRKLAYPIQDQFKASFALMNVECNQEAIKEIKSSFKFNDSIIRDLILVSKKAHTEISALSTQNPEGEAGEDYMLKEEKFPKEGLSKQKQSATEVTFKLRPKEEDQEKEK